MAALVEERDDAGADEATAADHCDSGVGQVGLGDARDAGRGCACCAGREDTERVDVLGRVDLVEQREHRPRWRGLDDDRGDEGVVVGAVDEFRDLAVADGVGHDDELWRDAERGEGAHLLFGRDAGRLHSCGPEWGVGR